MLGYLSEIFASFQGEGSRVGERHLFVRFAGCNLRCRYCDTPDALERSSTWRWHEPSSSEVHVRQNPVSPEELRAAVHYFRQREPGLQMIALTGGEPLVQAKFLREFIGEVAPGLPILLETNGMLPQQLALVLPAVQVISMDIKLPSNSGERAFWTEHREFLALAKERECYVKVPVDDRTAPGEVAEAAALVADVAPATTMFLQPIVDPDGTVCISPAKLAALFETARQRHRLVRVLPQVHKFLGIL
ncbi:MAG: 7-carboxy-7-deazaguanine synthase [Candidatus Binatia bacterium]|nr:MAG: 7-carboxy-7-deazaguanine synthase [Candidatus Binatia bacterium]